MSTIIFVVLILLTGFCRSASGWTSSSHPRLEVFGGSRQFRPQLFKPMSFGMTRNPGEIDTEEREDVPTWCPEQQIYIGGVVPDNSDLERLLSENDGFLRIFGYGSLCWNPGSGATLSRKEDGVTTALGRAVGWKRCWAQRSADHRGTPAFPGLVCTLLTDEEVAAIRQKESDVVEESHSSSLTEGVIYTVPPELVQECLAELDFREKGGYERDVIDVIEDDTGKTVQALLYRGTPANPAFWTRALLDLSFASAVMTVSIGPSGKNSDYLYNLDRFLADASAASPAAAAAFEDHTGDSDTMDLASMARSLQEKNLYFLFGSGSNQHDQLLLRSPTNCAGLVNGDEAHELKEIVLVAPPTGGMSPPKPKQVFCGGGHSALLTQDGHLYLWGWNEHGQLGHNTRVGVVEDRSPLPVVEPLHGIRVDTAALGHSHTLVIERDTRALYAFGDNSRGQVDGKLGSHVVAKPTPVAFVEGEKFIHAAAGLFHSAAITANGELVTFGCRRFGQCVHSESGAQAENDHSKVAVGRWRPNDGSRLVKVACGHRHTVVLDEHGRIWTMGNNKYGQLGVKELSKSGAARIHPHLVDGRLGVKGSGCYDIDCGWSHNFALVKSDPSVTGAVHIYGWGRNDKGQLGIGSFENISEPQNLHGNVGGRAIVSLSCGSESTMVLDEDENIWGTGWNEHGNLSIGPPKDVCEFTQVKGARITSPPTLDGNGGKVMAAGGAHYLSIAT